MTDRLYQQRFVMQARLGKGGYLYEWDILDSGKVIGRKSAVRATRDTTEVLTYAFGDQRFGCAKEFIEAYEASLVKEGEVA